MEFHISAIDIPNGKSFLVRKQSVEEFSIIHTHKTYELDLLTSGSGKRIVGNNVSAFENYDLVLIGPDLPHNRELYESDENTPPVVLTLYISESIINNSIIHIPELESIRDLFSRSLSGIAFKEADIKALAKQIEHLAKTEGIESFIELIKLLSSLAEIKEQEILSLAPELPVSYYKDLDQIKIVYNYVSQNLQEVVTLDIAAGLLHMAPGSFCRYFKKRTGKTFIQYVKDIRISLASKMLSGTEKPIAQICYESGYNNLANFNFYFKSVMNMTPSEYRKNFR